MPKIPNSVKKTLSVTRTKTFRRNVQESPKTELTSEDSGLGVRFNQLLEWLVPVPDEWIKLDIEDEPNLKLEPIECTSYEELVQVWRKAIKWRPDLDDLLVSMLSVCVSVVQQGDQLFLMVIGNASGGKTTFCEGLLVSDYCYPIEYLSGFFSGFKDGEGNDYSLASRINGKILITPEGDTMVSHPKFPEHMSQARRLFDGSITTSYKNQKEDIKYAGMRIPWIMVGTPALLEQDQSRLGDRFLKSFVKDPSNEQRKDILKRATRSALEAVKVRSVGERLVNESMTTAQCMTGGYVNYLVDNAEKLLGDVDVTDDDLEFCEKLGEFVAFMRARPGKTEESPVAKEEPFRLAKQFVRYTVSKSATLNLKHVDDNVKRKIRKCALDTSKGLVFDITKVLAESEAGYLASKSVSIYVDRSTELTSNYLKFMRKIGIIELMTDKGRAVRNSKPMYRLTEHVRDLYSYCVK